MKLKSELYMQELAVILHGLNLQVVECTKILKRERIKTQILCFFMPWNATRLWSVLSINADFIANHVSMMGELRDKILLSEGVDADMQPITLQDIYKMDDSSQFPVN